MPPKKKSEIDFAKAFDELEGITAWFEQGEPDLEKGLQKFERATELAKALKTKLEEAENKIKEIRLKSDS
ncbi:exodeoxyribonuclease VII small subunit [Candidatus Uhrbacteria bacterium CG22_combo_CG10-13_8_21_14_all_47_17]|uniref:Exodeoxyribonuclease 7 small subunit n=1 Tax=Candidatus Uhrbacteria bacterium CG22_combo_CG10-13_8_21_14_all_47_17 TaxID=1975041 RepID=A0A2H0BTE9_9BACT|nr:MAG: exodeoxyribonuclease VII small subunit [Candidatus Uhrbacteria bacterium CG22_combo_CG10-13_8_21_14_all_47_17]